MLLFDPRALADTAAIQIIDTAPAATCAGACRDGDRLIAAIPVRDAAGVGAIPVRDGAGVRAIPGAGMISLASAEPNRSTPLFVRTGAAQLFGAGSARAKSVEPHGSMSGSLLVFGSVMTGIGALGRRLARPIA
jgi:hypothetical protein